MPHFYPQDSFNTAIEDRTLREKKKYTKNTDSAEKEEVQFA